MFEKKSMETYGLAKIIFQGCCFGLVLSSIISCHKEKITQPLTASFQVREVISSSDFWSKETYDTDSVSTPEIQFIANQPDDSSVVYQWKIGSDVRTFNKREFSLWFSSGVDSVKVTLQVQKKKIDGSIIEMRTASRVFYLRKSQIEGLYQGFFEGISQRADVYIKRDFIIPGWSYALKGIMITTNIPKYDSLFSPNDWQEHVVLNRRIYFDWANTVADGINPNVKFPNGSIGLDRDYRTLNIDLTVTEVGTEKKMPMKFKGTKIF